MKQNLSHNKELLAELITEITLLKVTLLENQTMLTEAQVFFNGGIESVIKIIRKTNNSLEVEI
jgi:hypothetical protein